MTVFLAFLQTAHSLIINRFPKCYLFSGAAKLGTDESAFNSILATRSWAHLRQVIAEYQAMHGRSLEKDVISEFSANAEKGLVGICKCLIIFLNIPILAIKLLFKMN